MRRMSAKRAKGGEQDSPAVGLILSMKTASHASSFNAGWWLLHALVIGAMCICGASLGQWLSTVLLEPIVPGDITMEWWQIFRKFVAITTMGMFLAVLLGYVLLIMPND